MAVYGTSGYRTVLSVAQEISLTLLQPIIMTTLTNAVSAGVQTATVPSTASMYAGALLVVGTGADIEVVSVGTVASATTFSATFASAHAA